MLIDAVILWILHNMSAPTWTYILVVVDIIYKLLDEILDI